MKKVTDLEAHIGRGGRVPRQREWYVRSLRGVGKDGVARE